MPTNVRADWSMVAALPDTTTPNTFIVLLPIQDLAQWVRWTPDQSMNSAFGIGNWSRLRMEALEWAYLSPDPCAHQPGPGFGQPVSLLTSSYDAGFVMGNLGAPLFPGATRFPGLTGVSMVEGNPGWTEESWQLRARGFQLNDYWNACANTGQLTPTFTGWLAARITYTVL
ncbi:MAG: hypothetical protein AB8H80_21575 [Planctomycetota bacterium]